METDWFFFDLKMSQLALSDSFEYICYGSIAIRDIVILSVRGPFYTSYVRSL